MSFLDDWKLKQTSVPRNEIAFFRFFADLLAKSFSEVRYYEVHGTPGHVEFASSLWPSQPPVRKELGDLIIIAYSYRHGVARYTVQQNKFNRAKGVQRTHPTFKFKADIHQYDLLAFRPNITPVGSINFPKKILSGTDYYSVASYGIFYEGSGHLIDFVYSTARWLTPQSYVRSCNLILNTLQSGFSIDGRELICVVGVEAFIEALLGMQIGAPMANDEIGRFLSGLIRVAAQSSGEDAPVIDLPFFNNDNEIEPGTDGFRLLLVNTDEIPKESFHGTH